jgi:hypothetical protein
VTLHREAVSPALLALLTSLMQAEDDPDPRDLTGQSWERVKAIISERNHL